MKTILFIVILSSACGKPWKDPGPRTVLEEFLIHVARGRNAEAFELIDPDDRPKLTLGQEVLPEELRLPEEEQLVVAGVDSKFSIKRIELTKLFEEEPPAGAPLELKLHYVNGATKRAYMVWRDGWYVDLIRTGT